MNLYKVIVVDKAFEGRNIKKKMKMLLTILNNYYQFYEIIEDLDFIHFRKYFLL